MEQKEVLFEIDEGVGIITLNRPERLNASSAGMTQGMIDIVSNLPDEVRAIVITGAGRAFCAGGDVKRMGESIASGRPAWQRSHAERHVSVAFWNCDRPVIGAINGHAVGVGLSYATMTDLRIASEEAKFGAYWVRRGYMPDGGGTFSLLRARLKRDAPKIIDTIATKIATLDSVCSIHGEILTAVFNRCACAII